MARIRGGLTVRAGVLAVALASVVLALALPLKVYLGQRDSIRHLQAQNQATSARVNQLEAQAERLQDPAYVETQARDRLHFVKPGETEYLLLGTAPRPATGVAGAGSRTATGPSAAPWYSALWQTVQAAGVAHPARSTRTATRR